jgi:hypothetical protein
MKQPSAILIAPTVFYIFIFARSPKVLEDADSNGLRKIGKGSGGKYFEETLSYFKKF